MSVTGAKKDSSLAEIAEGAKVKNIGIGKVCGVN
jgi:hypothetical protein